MKKSAIILCVLFSSLHAAENKSCELSINNTLFRITKGNIYDKHLTCDVMVVGLNQQSNLSKPSLDDVHQLGDVLLLQEKTVRVLPREHDSSSEDTYRSWEDTESKWLYKKAQDKKLSCAVVSVYEPRIGYGRLYKNPKNYEYFKSTNHIRPLL